MKFILLLLLVASCSTKEKNDAVIPSEAATESESKPVSPYTVKPCFCMKIFRPVCADGITYGNSCEAECHGHTSWTEGACGKPPKK